MLAAMASYVDDFLAAFRSTRTLELPNASSLDHIVLSGMGGSGIGSSLCAALVLDSAPCPVVVTKDYAIPRFVGARTLFIATSYSGETEETLYALAKAHQAGAQVAGLASGGTLLRFLESHRRPAYRVPGGRQPRAALPLLFGGLAGMMDRIGAGRLGLADSEARGLKRRQARLLPTAPKRSNESRRVAEIVHRQAPTIYGEGALAPVALRWKAQLNENAKMFAQSESLPEASHNDLVPWSTRRKTPSDCLVLIRSAQESRETRTRFEFLSELATRQSFPTVTVRAEGESRTARSLDALMVGDYASVYAAERRGVDPDAVPVIQRLKDRLEDHGLAAEARRLLGV